MKKWQLPIPHTNYMAIARNAKPSKSSWTRKKMFRLPEQYSAIAQDAHVIEREAIECLYVPRRRPETLMIGSFPGRR